MISSFTRSESFSLGFRLIHQVAFLSTVILSLTSGAVFAGSATWNSTNGSIGWENDLNWLPNTIPNDPGDVATFGSGTTPFANPTSTHNIDSMVFAPGAGVYTITVFSTHFELSGAGIVNNSAVLQNFIVPASAFPDGEEVFYITGAASAGNLTQITNQNGDNDAFGGILDFEDESTAGTAAIYNLGSPEVYNGLTLFYGASSAGAATITNQPGMFYAGGGCGFNDTSNAGTATIINNAATVSNGAGGGVAFADSSSAAHSTIICNGNPAGSYTPAEVAFLGDSKADAARIILHGDGQLSIGGHNPPGVTIASLEGDGNVVLTYLSDTPNTLTVGSNNRSTTFAGVIQDRSTQIGGSLAKVGNGTLTLTGPNTYAGGTTVNSGILKVNNSFGSGTGSGLLRVNKGTLAGSGIIGGEVIVGRKSGTGGAALLEPSVGSSGPSTLTIQGALTFNAVSTYVYKLDSARRKSDMVVTKGLRIESGAQFSASDLGSAVIPPGKVFTAVNNTAMTPISGAFANLVDGTIVAIGENMFQVSYTGGDGNDLTLTVVTP